MSEHMLKLEADSVWKVIYLDSVDSTNTQAKKEARLGAHDRTIVVAEEQTAGRGRRGRSFESTRGQGIFMSLLLRPQIQPGQATMLTLIAGLAVRKAIVECTGVETLIKWPNDLVINGRKLCGILTEMQANVNQVEYVVVGIGINVNQEFFSEELEWVATSVFRETGKKFDRMEIITAVLRWFEHYYHRFQVTCDLSELKEEYNSYMINLGKEVVIEPANGKYSAIARGITDNGELLVERSGIQEKVLSGEVSVRGVYGYV